MRSSLSWATRSQSSSDATLQKSGQIIAISHDRKTNGGLVMEIPLDAASVGRLVKYFNLASKNGNRVVSKILDDFCVLFVYPQTPNLCWNESMLTIFFLMGGNKNTKWNILWVAVNFTSPHEFLPAGLEYSRFHGRRGGCKPTKDCYVSGTIGLAYVGTVCQMEKLLGFSILRVLTCVVNLQKGRHQVRWPKLSKTNGFFQVKCCQVINVVLYIAHACKRLVLVVGRLGDVLKNRVNSGNNGCCFEKHVFFRFFVLDGQIRHICSTWFVSLP